MVFHTLTEQQRTSLDDKKLQALTQAAHRQPAPRSAARLVFEGCAGCWPCSATLRKVRRMAPLRLARRRTQGRNMTRLGYTTRILCTQLKTSVCSRAEGTVASDRSAIPAVACSPNFPTVNSNAVWLYSSESVLAHDEEITQHNNCSPCAALFNDTSGHQCSCARLFPVSTMECK